MGAYTRVHDDATAALKIPPHSIEAEQAVLGGLMLDNNAWDRVADSISVQDFYRGDHRRIFEAIHSLADHGGPFDVVTLAEWLDERGELDRVGGISYLGALASNTPSAANIGAYAEIVLKRAKARAALAAAQEATESLSAGQDPAEAISDLQACLEHLAHSSGAPYLTFAEAVNHALDAVDLAAQRRMAGGTVGAPTGLPALDRRTGGIFGQRLYVVAGRPSLGKSALVWQIVLHAAARGQAAGFVALEMGADELATRAMAHRFQANVTRLAQGFDDAVDVAAKGISDPGFMGLPIFIDSDSYGLSAIVSRITEWRRKHGIAFAVVDHIGLVELERDMSRNDQLGHVSRTLKKLAKRLDMPIVAVSQLNRRVETEKRRPMLSDLRDSGNVEQDADVCLFIHTDEADDEKPKRAVELGLLKNRGGVRGWIAARFEFEGATQTFREVAGGTHGGGYG